MLEHIGEDVDANFNLKPDKIMDKNYNKALHCLRKHLHVIEYVLYLILIICICIHVLCNYVHLFATTYKFRRRFAELIESTFTKIFLVSVSLNMIGGSICGIQVRPPFYVIIHNGNCCSKRKEFF